MLAGRSAPDAAAQAAIAAMEADGVQVHGAAPTSRTAAGVDAVMAALAASPAPLARRAALRRRARRRRAGAADAPSASPRVMAPKADGAWRLHNALEQARHRGLDFFALYSSMSAVLGSPGQGNYVAANAFLDALARTAGRGDLPATSIAWGAWKDVGMATRGHDRRAGRVARTAVALAGAGHAGPEPAAARRHGQAAVAPIDWPPLLRRLGDAAAPALLDDLVTVARRHAAGPGRSVPLTPPPVSTRPRSEVADRARHIEALVRRELATVLGLPAGAAAKTGFTSPRISTSISPLAMDSVRPVGVAARLAEHRLPAEQHARAHRADGDVQQVHRHLRLGGVRAARGGAAADGETAPGGREVMGHLRDRVRGHARRAGHRGDVHALHRGGERLAVHARSHQALVDDDPQHREGDQPFGAGRVAHPLVGVGRRQRLARLDVATNVPRALAEGVHRARSRARTGRWRATSRAGRRRTTEV